LEPYSATSQTRWSRTGEDPSIGHHQFSIALIEAF
jgi:hypothetical protein